jgi:hypothetical protein
MTCKSESGQPAVRDRLPLPNTVLAQWAVRWAHYCHWSMVDEYTHDHTMALQT